jgi:hypothetical protein
MTEINLSKYCLTQEEFLKQSDLQTLLKGNSLNSSLLSYSDLTFDTKYVVNFNNQECYIVSLIANDYVKIFHNPLVNLWVVHCYSIKTYLLFRNFKSLQKTILKITVTEKSTTKTVTIEQCDKIAKEDYVKKSTKVKVSIKTTTEITNVLTELNQDDMDERFKVIKNKANGNCFFDSLSFLLDNKIRGNEIRKKVAEFYGTFEPTAEYMEETFEHSLAMGMTYDNEDDGGIEHDKNIKNNYVWANMNDVRICSHLFNININLYRKFEHKTKGTVYFLDVVDFNPNGETVSVLYNGVDHFEALQKPTVSAPSLK